MKLFVGELKRKVGLRETKFFSCSIPSVLDQGDMVVFDAPVSATTTLTNAGGGIIAETEVRGVARLRCSRCLEEFTLPVTTEFRVEFRETAPEKTDAEEDEDIIPYSGDYVDLDDVIRQNLVLALPMKPLCDSACKGLCPQCGANLNRGECSCERTPADPRLARLGELQARLRGRGGES